MALPALAIPIAKIAAPLIATGLGGMFNYFGGKSAETNAIRANQANIDFQRQTNDTNAVRAALMANQERKWAVQDWEKQNAYNHPLQQMQRLKEAGLNPHLVYGSGAQTASVQMRGTSATPSKDIAPQIDPSAVNNAIMQQAQSPMIAANMGLDLARLQQVEKDTELKDAVILKTISETNTNSFDLTQKKRLADMIYSMTMDNMFTATEKNKQARIQASWEERKQAQEFDKRDLGNQTSKESLERIKALTKLAQQQGKINQTEVDMIEAMSANSKQAAMLITILGKILGK